jgi:hypothetical protein
MNMSLLCLLVGLWLVGVCCGLEKLASKDTTTISPPSKLSLVYVYTIVPKVCEKGFPSYIFDLWRHLIKFHSMNNEVVFLSNFQQCPKLDAVKTEPEYQRITFVDVDAIQSDQTRTFLNASKDIFMSDGDNELWYTSATRFFHLYDYMLHRNLQEAIHLEADNLLYSNFSATSSHVKTLRMKRAYPMAITPLVANKHLLTASFFWVGQRDVFLNLLQYFVHLATKTPRTLWDQYVNYLRRYETSRRQGVEPDAFGRTIKPFAINEMTMLAYYHVLHNDQLVFLSVVPYYAEYKVFRPFCDLKTFQPTGSEVGPALLNQEFYEHKLTYPKAEELRNNNRSTINVYSIFDAGSWGQYLGKKKKNIFFWFFLFFRLDADTRKSCLKEKDVRKEWRRVPN